MPIEQCPHCDGELGTPDRASFWYMFDNHAFARLSGSTLDEILAHAERVVTGAGGDSGMVCGAILLRGEREVGRVRARIHIRGQWGNGADWKQKVAEWRRAHEADADVMRLLSHSSDPLPPAAP